MGKGFYGVLVGVVVFREGVGERLFWGKGEEQSGILDMRRIQVDWVVTLSWGRFGIPMWYRGRSDDVAKKQTREQRTNSSGPNTPTNSRVSKSGNERVSAYLGKE